MIDTEGIMILAGDIGATNTRLGLFSRHQGAKLPLRQKNFKNRDYSGLEALLQQLPFDPAEITDVCLGVAGPVIDGRSCVTNLNWEIDSESLRKRYRNARVFLLNDMEATAYGVDLLEADELFVLNEGVRQRSATAGLIAAGTGLGESILYHNGCGVVPLPAECGHCDFAPNTELETALLCHLRGRYGHVSVERVLSGPGLKLIYQFLVESGRARANAGVAERMREGDSSAVIAAAAMKRQCEACAEALDLFASIYGAESGNLALRALAHGGVFIGGGIAPKIKEKLAEGTFLRAFRFKGRMSSLLETIPVYVILNQNTALAGAAHYAIARREDER